MTTTTFSQTAAFVIATARASITVRVEPAPMEYLSFTGTFDGGAGQCVDSIAVATDDSRVARICELWNVFHMRRAPFDAETESAIAEARDILTSLDGARIDCVTPDPLEDATFSESDDIIDSRDVISRLEELRNYFADLDELPASETYDPDTDPMGDRSEAVDELESLTELDRQGDNYAPDWHYGETLIRDSYFADYAEEFADDIGAVNKESTWPNNHIDWEAAAMELQSDYTSIEWRGVTYWIH